MEMELPDNPLFMKDDPISPELLLVDPSVNGPLPTQMTEFDGDAVGGDYGDYSMFNMDYDAVVPDLNFGDDDGSDMTWMNGDDDNSTTLSLTGNLNCTNHLLFALDMNNYFSQNQISVPIVYCLISLLGLIGNGLVMFVIIGSKEITKTVANIYILNLAVADTLFLMTLPLVATQRVQLGWPFGVGICKVSEAIKHLNIFASVFFLTAMSVDRYLAVVYVVASNRYRTNKYTFYACALIWMLSIVMAIPLLIYTDVQGGLCRLQFNLAENLTGPPETELYDDLPEYYPGADYKSLCDFLPPMPGGDYGSFPDYQSYGSGDYTIEKPDNGTKPLVMMCKHPPSRPFHIFIIFSFVFGFFIPFCVITVCYVMILVKLAQSSETARTRSKQAERTRRKVTRMVVALVVAFFFCWLPFHAFHLLQIPGIKVKKNICRRIGDFTFCLGFANSCLNPILYTFLGHNFQERLRKSIVLSLRSFSFSNFTRYTTNHTMSRAETGPLTKKEGGSNNSEPHGLVLSRLQTPQAHLSQLPEEEPCLPVDSNSNFPSKV